MSKIGTEYIIEINGVDVEVVDGALSGLAHLKFDSVSLRDDLRVVLYECNFGEGFDPVLHSRRRPIKVSDAERPCKKDCSWRKSIESDFYTTPRITSVRSEVMCPGSRCGFLLKPECYGGSFWDYDYCNRPNL